MLLKMKEQIFLYAIENLTGSLSATKIPFSLSDEIFSHVLPFVPLHAN
jgi:hypothetical protein